MRPRVAVTLPLPDLAREALEAHFDIEMWDKPSPIPDATLSAWAATAHGVLCSLSANMDARVIEAAPELRVISSVSVGVDHIDVACATVAGIPVGHTPGVLVDTTADLALALMLDVTRRVSEADRFVRAGGWKTPWSDSLYLGTDLSRATVGLVGLGPIGQAVARRLKGFGARVIGWNRTVRDLAEIEQLPLDDVMEQADIISLHVAATPDTHHLIDARRLAKMRDGAVLINTARGAVVDEAALAGELNRGRLRAGLDVFECEPLPAASPLHGLENAVLLPHLGSATLATRRAMFERAMANLFEGLRGERVTYCANPEVYGPKG